MSTQRYNRIKYYNAIINVAFSFLNNEHFQIQLFPNTMRAMLEKIHMYKRTYYTLYRTLTH